MASSSAHRKNRPDLSWVMRLAAVAGIALVVVSMVACHRGPRNFENANDRLRAENLQLERQTEALQAKLDRRLGELKNLRQQLAQRQAAPMPGADPPTLADLEFGNYSGGVDTDDDSVDDLIRVYLRPLDQQGRLLPVAGRAVVQAVAIPAQGEPRTIAERTYEPAEFDEAYRSGFTGDHYTLELELPDELPQALHEVTVKVTFTQADTGVELNAQEAFRIRHGE